MGDTRQPLLIRTLLILAEPIGLAEIKVPCKGFLIEWAYWHSMTNRYCQPTWEWQMAGNGQLYNMLVGTRAGLQPRDTQGLVSSNSRAPDPMSMVPRGAIHRAKPNPSSLVARVQKELLQESASRKLPEDGDAMDCA